MFLFKRKCVVGYNKVESLSMLDLSSIFFIPRKAVTALMLVMDMLRWDMCTVPIDKPNYSIRQIG